MKTVILACLLATSPASAFAEWTRIGSTDSMIAFIDFKTIRKDGNLRKVWQIQDYKQLTDDKKMSSRVRLEFNCKEERTRNLTISTHSKSMAEGETLNSFTVIDDQWSDVPPDTISETILKLVCAK